VIVLCFFPRFPGKGGDGEWNVYEEHWKHNLTQVPPVWREIGKITRYYQHMRLDLQHYEFSLDVDEKLQIDEIYHTVGLIAHNPSEKTCLCFDRGLNLST